MSYQMILSDLDETLLVDMHVPQFNRDAITKAREKGVRFVVATGRSDEMIADILHEIGTYDMPGEYSICFNGGLVIENKNSKVLHFHGIDYEDAKFIYEEGIRRGLGIIIFTDECCYLINTDQSEIDRKVEQHATFKALVNPDISFLKGRKIAKAMLVKRDMEYLLKLREEIYPKVSDRMELSFSSNRYLECNAKGIDKGYGLRWLADYLGIPVKDSIAVGDNYNDLAMIEEAGLGCCVLSAAKDIKKKADYVCQNDYDQGAVKEVIEKFIL